MALVLAHTYTASSRHHRFLVGLFVVVVICLGVLCLTPQRAHAAISADAIARAVTTFFPGAPQMVAIAKCESGLRQYDESGATLRGGYGGGMIGLFQLNETYHREQARSLGYDIDTLMGNILYARWLWQQEGTTPWDPSAHCWASALMPAVAEASEIIPIQPSMEKRVAVHATQASVSSITKTLRFGMYDDEVRILQQTLNRAGYIVAASGAGSPGRETDYFGVATYKALLTFQCEQKIACLSGTSATRAGVGTTNTLTRAALQKIGE